HSLRRQGIERIEEISRQMLLPIATLDDQKILSYLQEVAPPVVTNIGPELVLGKVFDSIGLSNIPEEMFRHIVLARLVYPVSKLKTSSYLLQHHGIEVDISSIYRFLDRFHLKYKDDVESIIYDHSRRMLGDIRIVFYDITTLYFEAEDEDDLRRIGFSKDGKFRNPQILLGLLIGQDGYPLGYDMFEGNKFEGHTLIPMITR